MEVVASQDQNPSTDDLFGTGESEKSTGCSQVVAKRLTTYLTGNRYVNTSERRSQVLLNIPVV